jgi:hypothetical protein
MFQFGTFLAGGGSVPGDGLKPVSVLLSVDAPTGDGVASGGVLAWFGCGWCSESANFAAASAAAMGGIVATLNVGFVFVRRFRFGLGPDGVVVGHGSFGFVMIGSINVGAASTPLGREATCDGVALGSTHALLRSD